MSGFVGWTRTRETCCVSARPRKVHVRPPSVDLKTPPPVVPIQYSLGRAAEPATATERPPRKMPISRHFRAANTVESYGAGAWAKRGEASNREQRARRRGAGTAILRLRW